MPPWTSPHWTAPVSYTHLDVYKRQRLYRSDLLKQTDAHIKFISAEPLLEDISEINLVGIDWLIVGGESGHNARMIDGEWVIKLRDLCMQNGTAFFFKQWGGFNKKKTGSKLEGKYYKDYPIA